ncbi:MAG TPA: hypothetical protein VF753_21265 [Terriglobales bacterium]
MKIWLGTREQRIAACTVLIMAGLCLFQRIDDFDMPHLHFETPSVPTASVSMFASAANTAAATVHGVSLSL